MIAASRLPYRSVLGDDVRAPWVPAVEGLLGALLPVAHDLDAVWVGGTAEGTAPPDVDVRLSPVALSHEELRDERDGFSGSTVWPLYHDIGAVSAFAADDWLHYVAVNRKVARAVAGVAAHGAVAWIHGYQLQLVPRMLRKLRADLRIGFFLHIPFPPTGLFAQLPWRRQLLLGLLGADVIGVPASSDAHNLVRCVRMQLGRRGVAHVVAPDGRRVRIRSYPVAVDVATLTALATAPETRRRMEQMRTDLGHPRRVFLGIDRLDHTTGLPQRISAFAELYGDGALDPAEAAFVQVVTPARERTERSRSLAEEVDRMIGHVNSRYGHLGHPPVTYLSRYLPRHEVVALYRLADVMVAAPLRGGMGLVAKEYVACRVADDGALVLSEFTAAADELPWAHLVNPYDVEAIKAALLSAVDEAVAESAARMHALRGRVRAQDVHAWARHVLDDLAAV